LQAAGGVQPAAAAGVLREGPRKSRGGRRGAGSRPRSSSGSWAGVPATSMPPEAWVSPPTPAAW